MKLLENPEIDRYSQPNSEARKGYSTAA